MYPRQHEFIEAFATGDSEKMAKPLISIAEEFCNVPLSGATGQDVEWSCRQIVEAMVEYSHSLGYMIDLRETRAHLMVNVFLQQEARGGGRPSQASTAIVRQASQTT